MMATSYSEMKMLSHRRANAEGFPVGTRVQFKKRTGTVVDVNAFFHDMPTFKVLVDLDAIDGRRPARQRDLIAIGDLTRLSEESEVVK